MSKFFSSPKFLLSIILFFAFLVRLYGFTNPVADWHSWRQADTSAVSRNFIKFGFDILHPRFDDLSNVPSGKDNPHGYRFVEFPIYNIFQAGLYKLFPLFTLEEWGRLVTIFSSLLTIYFIYFLMRKHISETAGFFSAFFYAFLPYNIYYGRVILPDPMMVMAIMGGIYFLDLAIEKNFNKPQGRIFLLFSVIFTACAMLLKPYAVFFTLPMFYLVWQKYEISFLKKWQLWAYAFLSILPLILWRLWMQQYPEGIPANAWLLNGNGIRFRPAFFRWMGYERVVKLISGFTGTILLIIGTVHIFQKKAYFVLPFLLASVLYVVIFATGNVQHDYYQILVMPSLAMLFAVGACTLINRKNNNRLVMTGALVILITSMFFFSGRLIKDYFNINNPSIVVAGKVVDSVTPKNAEIIANYNGDTSFLYQTNRQGWASFEKPLNEMIAMGATYMVLANPTEADKGFKKDYKVVAQTNQYILFSLTEKP